jgi:hypothetical protein
MALERSSLAQQFRLMRRQQKSAFNFAIFHESSLPVIFADALSEILRSSALWTCHRLTGNYYLINR